MSELTITIWIGGLPIFGPLIADVESSHTARVPGKSVMRFARVLCVMFAMFALGGDCVLAEDPLFVQHQNVVYAEVHGVGLVMDIFVPKGEKNGLAVVDVVSGV